MAHPVAGAQWDRAAIAPRAGSRRRHGARRDGDGPCSTRSHGARDHQGQIRDDEGRDHRQGAEGREPGRSLRLSRSAAERRAPVRQARRGARRQRSRLDGADEQDDGHLERRRDAAGRHDPLRRRRRHVVGDVHDPGRQRALCPRARHPRGRVGRRAAQRLSPPAAADVPRGLRRPAAGGRRHARDARRHRPLARDRRARRRPAAQGAQQGRSRPAPRPPRQRRAAVRQAGAARSSASTRACSCSRARTRPGSPA